MERDIAAERGSIDEAVEGRTLCTAFADTAGSHPDLEALRWRTPDGWQALTWSRYRDRVSEACLGLQALGFERGSFAGILMGNRTEHVIADLAVVHAGGIPVSLYATLAPEQIAYILNHCEASIVVIEDGGFLDRLLAVRDQLPHLRWVIAVEPSADSTLIAWKDLIDSGRDRAAANPEAFDASWRQVEPGDLATLIYTSGTTGPPKAVMIDHRNVLWTVETGRRRRVLVAGDRQISYLPLAHVAERFVGHWSSVVNGTTVSFCPDLADLGRCLLEVRPQFLFGAPRVWEKLYAGINAAIAAAPDDSRRAAVETAIEVGRRVGAHEQRHESVPAELAAQHTAMAPALAALRARVGLDELRVAMTGAAPIATEVIEFFRAIGVPLTEIWGMSELTGPGSWRIEGFRVGSVGVSIDGEEVRVDADGELLVRGGNVMRGYYRDPGTTAETLSADGWLRTGDIADIDDEGNIRIVDRKKELIITSGGKNVSPANLESMLKQNPLIGQVCVVGDRRPFLTALLVLDGQAAPVWAARHGRPEATVAELSADPELLAEVESWVAAVNARVSRAEQIRGFRVLDAEWTAESEELTPTLKLKRRVVLEKFGDVIEAMYTEARTPA